METFPAPGPIRDLAYYLYPLRRNDVWRWNVEQLVRRIDLFNGRRVVAIAVDGQTVRPREVMRAFGGSVQQGDFIVVQNDRRLREVAGFLPLFERVQTLDPRRCLLFAHGKGVTHDGAEVSRLWADALYRIMLDHWPAVERDLETHPLTGAFRWRARMWAESASTWFYSGSWVWYRSANLFFQPDWRTIDRFWTGIEPYPSLHFSHGEAGCLVGDECGNLYDPMNWKRRITPELERWYAGRDVHHGRLPESGAAVS